MSIRLSDEVMYLKGVGPQRAAILEKRGIRTVEELLYHLPFRYEDRTQFSRIRDIQPGGTYTVLAEVVSGSTMRFARGRQAIYIAVLKDAEAAAPKAPGVALGGGPLLYCRFFNSPYLEGRLKFGQKLVVHGKAERDKYRPARMEMVNPQIELLANADDAADSTEVGRIVPVYEAIGSLTARVLRRVVHGAMEALNGTDVDPLPPDIRERFRYPTRRASLLRVHFPPQDEKLELLNSFRTPAHQRLIFEEFFYFQLGLALRRQQTQREPGIALRVREDRIRAAVKKILPFKPTGAQKKVLAEIVADMERPAPMNRLLQGDVGSGKTIVAFEAATIAIENGYQAALMAPTEILAVQHFLSARRIFQPAGYTCELLISGLGAAEKRAARERVRSGTAQIVVGTHALIEEAVQFSRLGLVIIDEQHRFGVMQRKRLMEKARLSISGAAAQNAIAPMPHVLVMTATPIPRTLSLTLYGDLDVSILDELPPGRAPVETRSVREPQLTGVWEQMRAEVRRGRQAYVIYPVVEESKQELKAATMEFARLSRDLFPELKLGLLHGRLASEKKEGVMAEFRAGKLHVLVATTVIEVGVDVPNATMMVIEHAERFGLAQLHQLRGRIGRGAQKSLCILVAPANMSEEATARIETMCETSDGFRIAEMDLKLRGPGEYFGTRQHGELSFQAAQPLRDRELLELARHEAFALVERAATLPAARAELQRLVDHLGPRWQRRYQLARVG